MDRWIRVFLMLLLAVAFPYLADRGPGLKIFFKNTSSKLPRLSAWKEHKILFADTIRNCEDSILNEELGIAYLSCDPGRDRWNPVLGAFEDQFWKTGDIWYYEYAKHSYEQPGVPRKVEIAGWNAEARARFHPLGLNIDFKSNTLFVTNLAEEPSIEMFQLSKDGTKATYKRTLRHPLMHAPNSIAPLSASEILFTNDHKWPMADHSILSPFETYLAYPGGTVVRLNLNSNEGEVLAKLPFANGIVTLNTTHIAVVSTSLPGVFIYSMEPKTKALTLLKKLRPTFLADNLRVDSNGHLLITGHPHPYYVDVIKNNNHKYNLDGDVDAKDLLPEKDRPRAPSWLAEWDGNEEGKLKDLYVGDEYGTACSASRDVKRGIGIMSALYDKGILMWKE